MYNYLITIFDTESKFSTKGRNFRLDNVSEEYSKGYFEGVKDSNPDKTVMFEKIK